MKPFWLCVGVILGVSFVHGNAQVRRATLTLPSTVLERSGEVPVVFRFDHGLTAQGQADGYRTDSHGRIVQDDASHVQLHDESELGLSGHGQLKVHWTDSLGRVVQDYARAIALHDEIEVSFTIDLSRAVAMQNTVEASIELDEVTPKGTNHIREEASVAFVAKPLMDGWKDYAIIMYQKYPAGIQPALQQIGINGGQYPGNNVALPDYLLSSNLRWYSEQIGTDFYAEYHRWRPDRPVNWSFQQAKDLYASDPTSKEAFKRHPSFWDPAWRTKIHDRLINVAVRNSPYRPFFYSLSDESGIADLGAAWDFDFSDQSLVPMRQWLFEQYGSLDALNAEWETHFTDWNLVYPLTTNEAMQKKGDNFAAWADFKNWMDFSYANALQMGVNAVHEVDPEALVGIVGAQKPGWGGYDYSRLAKTVSVMEPYDIGGSVKVVHSLNPSMPLLTTTFASGDWEKHRVWFELLQGERGLILWDDTQRYILPDGSKGVAGNSAESYYNEIRDGIGALIINSIPRGDGIAVHYSQPSMRTAWMLERRPDGNAWMKRDAKYERMNNDFLRLRESWGHAIEDQGLQYSYVSYTGVEEGALLSRGYRMLILPDSSSLSQKEADNIRSFVASGGVVVADGMPGTFDEHSRRLAESSLVDLFSGDHSKPLTIKVCGKGKAIFVHADVLSYLQARLTGKEGPTYNLMADLFRASDIHPNIPVTDDHGKPLVGVSVHTFSNGSVQLLALQSSPQQSVDELGPADFHSNQRFEKSRRVHIHLAAAVNAYDVRQKKYMGEQKEVTLTVDPYEPTILALTGARAPQLQVFVPTKAEAGSVVPIALSQPATTSAVQIYHVEVMDPAGKRLLQYTGNVIATDGAGVRELPLAKNDPRGNWTIRVQDLLTGDVETRTLSVN